MRVRGVIARDAPLRSGTRSPARGGMANDGRAARPSVEFGYMIECRHGDERLGIVDRAPRDMTDRRHQDAFVETVGQQHPLGIESRYSARRARRARVHGIRRARRVGCSAAVASSTRGEQPPVFSLKWRRSPSPRSGIALQHVMSRYCADLGRAARTSRASDRGVRLQAFGAASAITVGAIPRARLRSPAAR